MNGRRSERDPSVELNNSARQGHSAVRPVRSCCRDDRLLDLTESPPESQIVYWEIEIRMIEKIEEIGSETESDMLSEFKILHHVQIGVEITGASKAVARQVSEAGLF